jgi:hypothetical protein
MIDTVLYDWIYDNFSLTDITKDGFIQFYYGSAEGASSAYSVMFKVTDLERPETLCNSQGETGRALFQFNFFSGGNTGESTNAVETLRIAEAFKEQFNQLRGVIGTTSQYRIENNVCQSARLIGEGSQTMGIWGAFFQAEIWWTEL